MTDTEYIAALEIAMVNAALPLEVLLADDTRQPIIEIGPMLRKALHHGLDCIREAAKLRANVVDLSAAAPSSL